MKQPTIKCEDYLTCKKIFQDEVIKDELHKVMLIYIVILIILLSLGLKLYYP